MNVLILSPDAVGGTFLERLITVIAQCQELDRPLIDIHRADLGLEKFYSPEFNRELLRFRSYHGQPLSEIQYLLEHADHYTLTKLIHYSMVARPDSTEAKRTFYQFLNDNFFIIATRRQNIFEHSLSWSINKITGKLNVYRGFEKILTFSPLFKEPVWIDPNGFLQSCEKYKQFLEWSETQFQIASYFVYEKHAQDCENYVRQLPIFSGRRKDTTWTETFGISFNDWNRCHFLSSDIGALALANDRDKIQLLLDANSPDLNSATQSQPIPPKLQFAYNAIADSTWPRIKTWQDYHDLPQHVKTEVSSHGLGYEVEHAQLEALLNIVNVSYHDYLSLHHERYVTAMGSIDQMQRLGILNGDFPIKKNTLLEKLHMISNTQEILDCYNRWIESNPDLGHRLTIDDLTEMGEKENAWWRDLSTSRIQPLLI